QEGSGRVQTVRMILVVSHAQAVSLSIDPAVVLATRKFVDDKAIEVKAYADGLMTSHVNDANPHKQYAPIASPSLTGVPTAPTVNSGNNSSQLATTAFVHNALADNAFALDFTGTVQNFDVPWDAKSGLYMADFVGSHTDVVLHFHGSAASCTALQFAARYGNGGLSYRTSRDSWGFEHDWEQIYTTGFRPSPADIGAISVSELTGIPLPWPQATAPDGWLKCNGQAFDKNRYPRLAQVYPSGVLPDLRGEFIRGWDDGRGADAGRQLGSWQEGSYMLQEVLDPPNNVVSFSCNSRKTLNWDTPVSNNINILARAVAAAGTWGNGAQGYIGVTRPRNIAFNYIVRAA
ncbi:phage tail protein, partial [Dickeya sp. CFBP 2040]|uniref:phage tail protein n=1 Tax=Dickeya sp. CFBP 2040 TaxID=2718531 RepID=UPI00144551EC